MTSTSLLLWGVVKKIGRRQMVMGNLTSNFFIKVDKSRLTNKTPPVIACEVQIVHVTRDTLHQFGAGNAEKYCDRSAAMT
jgi:hypothetical protein